jgi:hypothetical protein
MNTLDRTPTQAAIAESTKLGCAFIMLGNERFALVDKADEVWLSKRLWNFNLRGYAARLQWVPGLRRDKLIYMAREILKSPKSSHVDHINRNKLDNRRCNLREASRSGNAGNVGKRVFRNRTPLSKFKGVTYDKSRRKFVALGKNKFKTVNLGRFSDERSAAKAYNVWASNHFGKFACLNAL